VHVKCMSSACQVHVKRVKCVKCTCRSRSNVCFALLQARKVSEGSSRARATACHRQGLASHSSSTMTSSKSVLVWRARLQPTTRPAAADSHLARRALAATRQEPAGTHCLVCATSVQQGRRKQTCLYKMASMPPGRLVDTSTHTLGTPPTTGVPIKFTSTASTREEGSEKVEIAQSLAPRDGKAVSQPPRHD
jgi:hypothetical protein